MTVMIVQTYGTQQVASEQTSGGGTMVPVNFLQMNGQDLLLMDGSNFAQLQWTWNKN